MIMIVILTMIHCDDYDFLFPYTSAATVDSLTIPTVQTVECLSVSVRSLCPNGHGCASPICNTCLPAALQRSSSRPTRSNSDACMSLASIAIPWLVAWLAETETGSQGRHFNSSVPLSTAI